MSEIKKVGFIGIGNMGGPMAANLVKKGFDLTAFDVRREVAERFVREHGGRVASALVDAGRDMNCAVFMVPDDKVVKRILFDDGLAYALPKGALAIDMSTSDPRSTVEIGKRLADRGIDYVDAPVMGGVIFARDATLDIMVGGDAAQIERALPLFGAMGRQIFRCGSLGSAHVLKALANYINACTLINVLEAMTVGRKFGLDPKVMADALTSMCAGRQHPLEKKVIPHVLTRKFGTGMALGFIAKDVKIAVDFAHAIGAAVPLGDRVKEIWAESVAQIGDKVDHTEIVRYWERAAGVSLEAK